MTRTVIFAFVLAVVGCDKSEPAPEKSADNTKQNQRDRDSDTKTPLDQAENAADIEITATIRKAVVGDDALSMNAKNVKIITSQGVVTLRGPVASQDEKTKVAALAKDTAGVKRVEDQLEIAVN